MKKHTTLVPVDIFGFQFMVSEEKGLSPEALWTAKEIVESFNTPSSEVLIAEIQNANALAEKNLKDCPLTTEEKAEMFIPEFPVKNRNKRAKSRDGKALEGRKHKGCADSNYGWKKYNKYCKEMSRKVSKRNFKEHWQEELPLPAGEWDECDYFWRRKEQEEEQYRNFFPHGDYICDPVKGYRCPENKEMNEHIDYLVHEEKLPEHEYDWDTDWDLADWNDSHATKEEQTYSHGYTEGYCEGFEADKQYVLNLLKNHGITVDLDALNAN